MYYTFAFKYSAHISHQISSAYLMECYAIEIVANDIKNPVQVQFDAFNAIAFRELWKLRNQFDEK